MSKAYAWRTRKSDSVLHKTTYNLISNKEVREYAIEREDATRQIIIIFFFFFYILIRQMCRCGRMLLYAL